MNDDLRGLTIQARGVASAAIEGGVYETGDPEVLRVFGFFPDIFRKDKHFGIGLELRRLHYQVG